MKKSILLLVALATVASLTMAPSTVFAESIGSLLYGKVMNCLNIPKETSSLAEFFILLSSVALVFVFYIATLAIGFIAYDLWYYYDNEPYKNKGEKFFEKKSQKIANVFF